LKLALFKNINESGKGISKDEKRKHGVVDFFKIMGRKFWNLFLLNMLYMLFYIPLAGAFILYGLEASTAVYIIATVLLLVFVVLFGPATSGLFKVLRAYCLEQPIFMAYTFFKGFREEFKKTFFWGIIDSVMLLSVYCAFKVYPQYFGDSYIKYLCLAVTAVVSLTVLMMNFYYFLLATSTSLSFKDTVKDSFFMVTIALKSNIISLILSLVISLIIFFIAYILSLWIIFFFLPASFVGLIITYNSYPYIQKYVINPYYREKGEVNPELEFEAAKEVAIFEDMGGKEKPVKFDRKKKAKKQAGKDIS
jgi:uncharacterized membrane protein YesL